MGEALFFYRKCIKLTMIQDIFIAFGGEILKVTCGTGNGPIKKYVSIIIIVCIHA